MARRAFVSSAFRARRYAPPPPVVLPQRSTFKSRRVLLIEDDDDSRDVMTALIELMGHSVVSAATPSEALRLGEENHPDVVLLDLGLPEMDGWELARRLREVGLTSARLIALTGSADPALRQAALAEGFHAYVVKPIPSEQLEALLSY